MLNSLTLLVGRSKAGVEFDASVKGTVWLMQAAFPVMRDQGHGLSAKTMHAIAAGRGMAGVGIAGMRERLRLLGGRLEIDSDGHGTTLWAIVPRQERAS